MNIQAKFLEIKQATENLDSLIKGMSGLREAILPREDIEHTVQTVLDPIVIDVYNRVDNALAKCEQEVGNGVQDIRSLQARFEERITELEQGVQSLRSTLNAIAGAMASYNR